MSFPKLGYKKAVAPSLALSPSGFDHFGEIEMPCHKAIMWRDPHVGKYSLHPLTQVNSLTTTS